MTEFSTTRRSAIAMAGAGLAAASWPPLARAAIDKDLLKKLERRAVAASALAELTKMVAVEAIANGRLLNPHETATVRVVADHATQHATLLGTVMKDELGADPPLAPKRTQIAGLLELRDAKAALRFAADLEQRAIAAHIAAVRVARDAQVLGALAGIIGSDAQHLVLLRQLLHEDPVPTAFERGAR